MKRKPAPGFSRLDCMANCDTLQLMSQLEEVSKKLTAYTASILDSGSLLLTP